MHTLIYWKIIGRSQITFAQRGGGGSPKGAFFAGTYLYLMLEGGQKFRKYAIVIFVRPMIANDDYSISMLSP